VELGAEQIGHIVVGLAVHHLLKGDDVRPTRTPHRRCHTMAHQVADASE
jgi:hypothetical protein